jgi:hypothetical protein
MVRFMALPRLPTADATVPFGKLSETIPELVDVRENRDISFSDGKQSPVIQPRTSSFTGSYFYEFIFVFNNSYSFGEWPSAKVVC